MPRTIEVSVRPDKADAILQRLAGCDGVVGLARQRGASLDPPGDVLTIRTTNDGTRAVLTALGDLRVTDGGSIATSEPRSLISPSYQDGLDRESNETIWEEMGFLLRRETNLGVNYLALMALAGAVAAVGLWTDALHVVIGAMVVAPGFEPLLRLTLGFVGGPRVLATRGAGSTLAGYLALALGAGLTLLVLKTVDSGTPPDLAQRSLVRYWTTLTPAGIVLSIIASAAGALVVVTQRSVLTVGVMIALALIPGMSIASMALVAGDPQLAVQGLVRWAVDALAVVAVGAVVVGLKQAIVHRRQALG